MSTMHARERLLVALAGGIPDRVPISTYELVGYNSLAWENFAPSYAGLMDVIRAQTDCVCMWNPASNEIFLASSWPVDVLVEERREGATTVTRRRLHTPRGVLTQTTRESDGIHTVWQVEHWCKSSEDVDRALAVPYRPLAYDWSDLARVRAEVGEHGIIMASLADPLCLAAELMAFGDYTVWAMTETEHFARTIDILGARVLENLHRMLQTGVVDLYRICGPEYATPPFLPPRFFARFVVPYVAEMVALIHRYGARARLHCHGRIGQVLEMIAETGADALDPCEPPPDGDVTLAEVKRRVGGRMAIFGNIELKLLEHGTPEEVREAVRECMRAAKEGGGYVIMPTAAPINEPLSPQTERNYRIFIETALECGPY